MMGEGLGECNSWEVKYRYRTSERACPTCGKGSIIQTKHKTGANTGKPKNFWCAPFKGGCGAGFQLDDKAITGQELGRKANPEIFDQVNTLLKMAQKRAHVLATINATSASEFFTQDLEDMPGMMAGGDDGPTETPEQVAARRLAEERAKAGNGAATVEPAETRAEVRSVTLADGVRIVPEELWGMFDRLEQAGGVETAIKMTSAFMTEKMGEGEAAKAVAELKLKHGIKPKGNKVASIQAILLDMFDLAMNASAAAAVNQEAHAEA